MLLMGNMNPENIIVGRVASSAASWNATICVSATAETYSPIERAATMKRSVVKKRSIRLPLIATSKRK